MAGQLIPLLGMDADLFQDATPQQGIAVWLDLMRTGETLLRAGRRHQIGPDGDLNQTYREWYAQQMLEHDQVVARMMDRIHGRTGGEKNSDGCDTIDPPSRPG